MKTHAAAAAVCLVWGAIAYTIGWTLGPRLSPPALAAVAVTMALAGAVIGYTTDRWVAWIGRHHHTSRGPR